ncbi:MAG: hypothetical protein HKL90_09250, partial [Elusimicrobia bacterium]|nr:hypothetical protein [Elusimicrobiota bacterium]
MDRWEIRATATEDDPDRHLLLIQGGPADVAALIKKFGALFGRPVPYRGEDFNLSLVLHRLDGPTRERLESWLRQRSPAAEAGASIAAASALVSSPMAEPPPITLAPPPAVAAEPTPDASLPFPVPIPPAPLPTVPMAAVPPMPELKPREPEIPPLIDLSVEPAAAPTPVPIPVPTPEPIAP